MELRDEYLKEFYGNVGVKADFTDSNGDNLYVGDVVRIEPSSELSVVCGNENNNDFNVMGLWREKNFINDSHWKIYKEKSYKSMKAGEKIKFIEYCEKIKEMTIEEIEKELGYSIKIVRERNKG